MVDNTKRESRLWIVTNIIHMIRMGYLRMSDQEWEKTHVCQQLREFAEHRPMDNQISGDAEYIYSTPTLSEMKKHWKWKQTYLPEAKGKAPGASPEIPEPIRHRAGRRRELKCYLRDSRPYLGTIFKIRTTKPNPTDSKRTERI